MDINELISLRLVHEIHTSERKSYKACRRRWDWLFRQNIYPKTTAKPLEFGVAYHKAMEHYYDPETWSWDREVVAEAAVQVFREKCEQQRKAALESGQQITFDDDIEADYDERVALGVGMLRYYFKKFAPVLDANWHPLEVELGFRVAIPDPRDSSKYLWCKCDLCWGKWVNHHGSLYASDEVIDDWQGLPVVYAGRLDVLAESDKGELWIIDWKTAATIRENDEVFMLLDDQIGSYVWALRALGYPVKGFVYHEQKKAYPQPPVMNKQRYKGRMFSVNKQFATEWEIYEQTVREQDTQAYEDGLYDEHIQWLKDFGGTFYRRTLIYKTDYETDRIAEYIGYEALEMIDQDLPIYPNPGRFGCNFCAFREPCIEKNAGGDYQYALDTLYEVREPYYMAQESSTESKGGR
jgi:hypothetical protein